MIHNTQHYDIIKENIQERYYAYANRRKWCYSTLVIQPAHRSMNFATEVHVTEDIQIRKVAHVREMEENGTFDVIFSTQSLKPSFPMHTRTLNYRFGNIEVAWEQILDYFLERITPEDIPSVKYVATINEIKEKWLQYNDDCVPVLYLDKGEFGDMWKVRLTNREDSHVWCDHLDPETITGHLCLSILRGGERSMQKGMARGVLFAVEKRTLADLHSMLDRMPRDTKDVIPERAYEFMRRGTL